MSKDKILLITIFIAAIAVRFLYFPDNIYFGYDQARDAFAALEIAKGDIKLIGPSTSFEGLHHGVLYYYLLAPAYFLADKDPVAASGLLRVINALGVVLVFLLTTKIFGKNIAFIAALLFAFSFEQTQFSIYMGNPAPAAISVLLLYLGLSLVVFAKKYFGLTLAAIGFGLSTQFQFALLYMLIPLTLNFAVFYRSFLKIPFRDWVVAFLALLISLSTFLVAEVKFGFQTSSTLLKLLNSDSEKTVQTILSGYLYAINRMVQLNFTGETNLHQPLLLLFGTVFLILLREKALRKKLLFLSIWFFSLLAAYIVQGGPKDLSKDIPLYYPNVGVSISLLIFSAVVINKVTEKNKIIGVGLIFLFIALNLLMVIKYNPYGTITDINVQQGMLLKDQKKILDLIYKSSDNQPFTVKALTMPFMINRLILAI